eukprot:3060456-Pyramimonas_sp.AAC.1
MPWRIPSTALPTCVTDTFGQVKPDVVQTSFAWNHRKCSFRNSRVSTLGSRLRRFCKLIGTSSLDQSGGRGRAAGFPAGRWISPLLSAASGSDPWQPSVIIRATGSTRGRLPRS